MFSQIPPLFQRIRRVPFGEFREIGPRSGRVRPVQVDCFAFDDLQRLQETVFKLVLHIGDLLVHVAVLEPGIVCEEVECPPRALAGKFRRIADFDRARKTVDADVERDEDRVGRLVETEPHPPPDGRGEPTPGLGDEHVAAVRHRKRTFPCAFQHALRIPDVAGAVVRTIEPVGVAERSGRRSLGEVELRSLVVIAVEAHHVAHRKFFIRRHGEGVVFRKTVLDPRRVVLRGSDQREDPPDPSKRVVRMVVLAETHRAQPVEHSVLRFPPAVFLGYLVEIFREHHIGVVRIHLADAELVRRDEDFSVLHFFRNPETALPLGRGRHLDDPPLFGVRDGERLSGTVEAVLLDQRTDEENRLSGGAAAFEGDTG